MTNNKYIIAMWKTISTVIYAGISAISYYFGIMLFAGLITGVAADASASIIRCMWIIDIVFFLSGTILMYFDIKNSIMMDKYHKDETLTWYQYLLFPFLNVEKNDIYFVKL